MTRDASHPARADGDHVGAARHSWLRRLTFIPRILLWKWVPAPMPQPLPAWMATELDVAMMGRALELARGAGEQGEVPVGAIVYRTSDATILGSAANTREHSHDPTAHAEVLAIKAAAASMGDWRLEGCTLVVTLEPCAMCAGAIVHARVSRVIFGALDPKAGFAGSLGNLLDDARLNHRPRLIGGVRAQECSALLKSFFRQLRARKRAGPGQTAQ